jgi:hypothetical protein
MTDKSGNQTEENNLCGCEFDAVADDSKLIEKLERFDPLTHGGEVMPSGLIGKEIIKGDL